MIAWFIQKHTCIEFAIVWHHWTGPSSRSLTAVLLVLVFLTKGGRDLFSAFRFAKSKKTNMGQLATKYSETESLKMVRVSQLCPRAPSSV